jgi:hypothetical protein
MRLRSMRLRRQFALRPSTLRPRHSILVSARDGTVIAIITEVGGDTITAAGRMVAGVMAAGVMTGEVTGTAGTAKFSCQLS